MHIFTRKVSSARRVEFKGIMGKALINANCKKLNIIRWLASLLGRKMFYYRCHYKPLGVFTFP